MDCGICDNFPKCFTDSTSHVGHHNEKTSLKLKNQNVSRLVLSAEQDFIYYPIDIFYIQQWLVLASSIEGSDI